MIKRRSLKKLYPAELPSEVPVYSADSAPTITPPEENAEALHTEMLVQAARQGDLAAFNSLVQYYEQRVYTLACRLLGDKEAAADATQDTFFQLYRALHQYRGGSFKSWLLRIASNLCYDQLRAKARRPSTSLDALVAEAEESGGAILAHLEDRGADPQDFALRHELLQEVELALQALPYEQRLVVILSDVQNLSYEEICDVTGYTLGTVKSRLNRGRLKMREYLHKYRELLPDESRP